MVKPLLKKLFSRVALEFIIAFLSVTSLLVYGYLRNETLVDDEKLKVENYFYDERERGDGSHHQDTQQKGVAIYNDEASASRSVPHSVTTTTFATSTATTSIPVLVYHKIYKPDLLLMIPNKKSAKKYSVDEAVFKKQMEYLYIHGYTPLTISDAIIKKKEKRLPSKPIVITFDDGWRSQFDVAYPILRQYQFPATFYIYTSVVGAPAYMSWNELEELAVSGMEIGDHTKTHPRLTKVTHDQLIEELVGSKQSLEKHLGITITDFAYPYGIYSQPIIDELKKDGYTSARTSRPGRSDDFSDLYQIQVMYAPNDMKLFSHWLENK